MDQLKKAMESATTGTATTGTAATGTATAGTTRPTSPRDHGNRIKLPKLAI